MATIVNDVLRKLKDVPQDLKLVVLINGQYYDFYAEDIRSTYVKPEKDEYGTSCYGIADRESKDSFQVMAFE